MKYFGVVLFENVRLDPTLWEKLVRVGKVVRISISGILTERNKSLGE